MSCTSRPRDAKFKEIMVRFPVERLPELEAICNSQSLKPGVFIRAEICKVLNKIKKAA